MDTKSRTGHGRRWRQWTEGEARTALEELTRSGVSLSEFARRKGVSVQRLGYWRKRLGHAEPPAFVAVTLPHSTRPPSAPIEISVGTVVVRIPDEIDADRIADIVTALSKRFEQC